MNALKLLMDSLGWLTSLSPAFAGVPGFGQSAFYAQYHQSDQPCVGLGSTTSYHGSYGLRTAFRFITVTPFPGSQTMTPF